MDLTSHQDKESGDALQKMRHFCSFQERYTGEVREKLRSLGVPPSKHEAIIVQLEQEKFLDDRRYAAAFARGKFRINKWGRRKISYELSGRGFPDRIIEKGLEEINEDEYLDTLHELVLRKFAEIKGEKKLTIRNKIFTFVTGKGFEPDLVSQAINELNF